MTEIESQIANYRREIELNPQQVETYQLLADALTKKGDLQGAIACYQKTLELQPNLWGVYQKLADIYRQQGQPSTAVATLEKAIELNPNFPWFYQKLGVILIELKRWEEAVVALEKAIKINPDFYLSYEKLGEALSKLEKWSEAVANYKNAAQIRALSYWGENKFGEALMKLGNFEEVIAAFNRAIKINPNLYFAVHNLGDALSKLKRWDEAIASFKGAIKICPNSYRSYRNLGNALWEKGEWEEAIVAYSQAIELNFDLTHSYARLQAILISLKIWPETFVASLLALESGVKQQLTDSPPKKFQSFLEEAIDYYRPIIQNLNLDIVGSKILSCLPKHQKFYLHLGNILAKDFWLREAIIIYSFGLQIKQNDLEIWRQIEGLLKEKERLEKQVKSISSDIKLNPNLGENYYNLGIALSKLQKWQQAAIAHRRAIELNPENPNYYNELGKVLEKQGLEEKAVTCYEKAIQLQPVRERKPIYINQPIKIKFVDFWPEFNPKVPFIFGEFLNKNYQICLSDEPDFVVYTVYGEEHKKYDCTKIFFTAENSHHYLSSINNEERNGIRQIDFGECDFAITHYYLEDPRHYRIPYYLSTRGFTAIEKLIKPQNIETITKHKKKFCCFVYSNAKALRRIQFFRKLCDYKKVDSAGKILNNLGFLVPHGNEFTNFMREYKFVISFENSSGLGYTTEKVFQAMQAWTVPIYWGNPWIDREFNPNSFINCHHYATDEEVIARVRELDTNEELYKEVLREPYLRQNQIIPSLENKRLLRFFNQIFNLV